MASPTPPYSDVVPLTAADKRLERSLNRIKIASSDVMEDGFSSASAEHVRALKGAGLEKQAGHMRKVDTDFRNASSSKRQRIAKCIGKSLVKMTRKRLVEWTIAAAVTPVGVEYALYEIRADGRLIEVSDVNLDGMVDELRIDVDYDGIPDYTLLDSDYDGYFDSVAEVDDGIISWLIEGLFSLFS